ncbi:MAG: L,D-transpeptidase [Actinomycetota bacterium]|nr:L,D-transpeptidase [Actinomycetota bacterium]MDH5224991.1 L,D-transpeptidase [Actinomycetota bacterium]
MTPRRSFIACIALLALLGASCGEYTDGSASAREFPEAAAPSTSPSPSPREFLEVGDVETAHETAQIVQAAAPAPKSIERWGWALRAKASRLNVYDDPNGGTTLRMSIDALNPWGQRIAFPIRGVRVRGDTTWYRILLGIEPNGSNGWVKGDDVTFDRIRHRVVVDLSERTLRHYRDGKLRHRFSVGIGAPGTPTTVGRFFVWAHLDPRDASGPYGSYLLGLSGFSKVLTYWPGGGRMAIHGTADPTDRGRQVSYGCPRVFNPQMNKLRGIPMGTTVVIRR